MLDVYKRLISSGLDSWPVVAHGFRQKYITAQCLAHYADLCLSQNDDKSFDLSLDLTEADSMYREDILERLNKDVIEVSSEYAEAHWKLVFLLNVFEAEISDEEKLKNLFAAFATLGYPDDLRKCSMYSSDENGPFFAMQRAIGELKRYLQEEQQT